MIPKNFSSRKFRPRSSPHWIIEILTDYNLILNLKLDLFLSIFKKVKATSLKQFVVWNWPYITNNDLSRFSVGWSWVESINSQHLITGTHYIACKEHLNKEYMHLLKTSYMKFYTFMSAKWMHTVEKVPQSNLCLHWPFRCR